MTFQSYLKTACLINFSRKLLNVLLSLLLLLGTLIIIIIIIIGINIITIFSRSCCSCRNLYSVTTPENAVLYEQLITNLSTYALMCHNVLD